MIKRIASFISRETRLLFAHPYMFSLRRFWCFLLRSVLWIKKDLRYRPSKHLCIEFPNRVWVSYVLMETFLYKVFSGMHGLKKVLDIWWFIWESALYLASHNDEVYCYEFSKENFHYLQRNCKQKQNITCFNAWVTTMSVDYIAYDAWSDVSSTIRISKASDAVKVKNINILDLVRDGDFDWFKLDIEWGEYDILSALLDHDMFSFKKWIIEFHDLSISKNISFLRKFIDFLVERWYAYRLLTNENKTLHISDLDALEYCNIYFSL